MGLLVFYILLVTSFCYFYARLPGQNQKVYFVVLTLYYLIFWVVNHYVFQLKGTTVDAVKFHNLALEISEGEPWEFGLGAQLFSGWIALLYKMFGINHAAASLVSVCLVIGSFGFMARLIEELKLSPSALWGVFVFFLLPSMVFRGVTTLRESYFIFLFSGACLAYAQFLIHRKPIHMLIFIFMFLAMMLLHKALMVFGAIALPVLLVCVRADESRGLRFIPSRALIIVFLAVPAISYFNLLALPSADLPKGLREINAVVTVDTEYVGRILTAKGEKEANASYHHKINTESWLDILDGLGKSYIYYLFKPFPADINSWMDIYAMAENLLFLLFLAGTFYFLFDTNNRMTAGIVGLLLILFFINSLIWGIGTTNWGTASRHHLVHHWIVYLFGGAGFLAWARQTIYEGVRTR